MTNWKLPPQTRGGYRWRMIGSLASLASTVGTTIAAWIEAAYVLDCRVEEDAEGPGYMSNLVWLPASAVSQWRVRRPSKRTPGGRAQGPRSCTESCKMSRWAHHSFIACNMP